MEKLLAIVIVALGTYLARYIPLRFGIKFGMEKYLEHASAGIISALFVTSLLSLKPLSVSLLAVVIVLLAYLKWRNLGLSIILGVIIHFILTTSIQKGY